QVKADIMNTAGHDLYVDGSANPSSDRYGPPRVGSGRIDAEDATANKVLAYDPEGGAVSVSFGPVAATAPVNLSREVTVENRSASAVTYDVAYDSIHDVPGADFTVAPQQVSLDPGESASLTVSLEIDDPSELTKAVDPTAGRFASTGYPRETLAEAFGRVLLEPTSPGISLRVPVYASPRPASNMSQPDSLEIHRTAATAGDPEQTAGLTLSGTGVGTSSGDNGKGDGDPDNDIESIAAGFELQATGGDNPECQGSAESGCWNLPQCQTPLDSACWNLPEEKYSALKQLGYTSDAPLVSNPANARAYFAVAVQAPWAIPSDKGVIQFDLDVDRDGTPDLFVYNSRLGDDDLYVSVLYDPSKPSGHRVVNTQLVNGRFGDTDTALYDSDVMVLPVSLDALAGYGVDAGNPRIDYGVETYSYFSDQAIDMIGVDPESGDLTDPLTANLYEPGLTVTDENGDGPLVEDQPGKELTVTRNVDSWEQDGGKGLMMVHFHNRVGEKAQAVTLKGATSNTGLYLAPGTLTARVEASGSGLPEPTGQVIFSVDGSEVGSAPIEDGIAVLNREVPHGATRQVLAEYPGDADFEASSDLKQRSDPTLTAKITTKGRNRFGWYRKPVTIVFHCTTRGSGLTEDCPYPRRLTRDGKKLHVKKTIVAFDGGKATAKVGGINIDRTAPVVRIRGVRRGATYRRIQRARCVPRDRTSGVLSCGIRWKRRGNRVIYTATATDRAGNRRVARTWIRVRR
ncbi:MAG: Ig-like domain repeat protein, partial [Solirubrobacterales bacterium]|nr:Ig-like domain repeat protein [Solirubrobacterales bacterium]